MLYGVNGIVKALHWQRPPMMMMMMMMAVAVVVMSVWLMFVGNCVQVSVVQCDRGSTRSGYRWKSGTSNLWLVSACCVCVSIVNCCLRHTHIYRQRHTDTVHSEWHYVCAWHINNFIHNERHFRHHCHHPLLLLSSTPGLKRISSTNPFLHSCCTFPSTGMTPWTPAVFRFSQACRF